VVIPLMTLLGVGAATLPWPWTEPTGWPTTPITGSVPSGFHALHHSQEELSVLTSFRAHPLMHTTGFLLATSVCHHPYQVVRHGCPNHVARARQGCMVAAAMQYERAGTGRREGDQGSGLYH